VCEVAPELTPGSTAWTQLVERVRRVSPDLLLLNEMPFGPWISAGDRFAAGAWDRSCRLHERGLERLAELGARFVLSTRPVESEGRRVNEGFVWSAETEAVTVHTKQYFPDEAGYYEARWFQAGPRHFRSVPAAGARAGFLICTEVMFNEHARHYGREGAQIIVVPRAVGDESLGRWRVAMQMAAIVSGCYVLSSNRDGVDSRGQRFGGRGWVVDPTGEVVAQTSSRTPVVGYELDLDLVREAQADYPCYVEE
jgi:N-carbamoylputrescine amidase